MPPDTRTLPPDTRTLDLPRARAPRSGWAARFATVPARAARLSGAAFATFVALSAAAYLVVQYLYIEHLPFVMDEFDGAYDVYLLRDKVPYADFAPYKTVLGYYLQLPALLLGAHVFGSDVWSGLAATKLWLALINAAGMAVTTVLASKLWSRRAAALALPLWVLMSNWLERSSELRVDTLTAWAGMGGLLALLFGRPGAAGTLTALSFCVSQKGIYYAASSLAALFLWTALARVRAVREGVRFAAGYAAVLAPYMLLFAVLAPVEEVASATFLSHRAIVFDEIYPNIRKYWAQSLAHNSLYYALAAVAAVPLVARTVRAAAGRELRDPARRDALLLGYGAALAACCIWHKQPWPYFFVLLVPTAFLLHTSCIEAVCGVLDRRARAVCIACGVPLLAGLIAGGMLHPGLRIFEHVESSNGYQRHMVQLAHALLAPGEYYLAGVDLLYDREQPSWLLRRMSLARRRMLSHDCDAHAKAILSDFRQRPPKLLVRNGRFRAIPGKVQRHLRANYARYWGAIELYAPRFDWRTKRLELAFGGRYRVVTRDRSAIHLDGRKVPSGTTIELRRGRVAVKASNRGRLYLAAPAHVDAMRDPRFKAPARLFANAYSR